MNPTTVTPSVSPTVGPTVGLIEGRTVVGPAMGLIVGLAVGLASGLMARSNFARAVTVRTVARGGHRSDQGWPPFPLGSYVELEQTVTV